ncbi:hypothetical protein [Photobacterium damselae]|uniref:hypothetical protein n=1 Tax=Photobacterium damselae TaxID=38293 RepID=UPI0040687B33
MDTSIAPNIDKTKLTLQLITRTLSFTESCVAYKNEDDILGIMRAATHRLIRRCDRNYLIQHQCEISNLVKYAVINIEGVIHDAESLELNSELQLFNKYWKHWLKLKKQSKKIAGVVIFIKDDIELKTHLENTKLNRCALFFTDLDSIAGIFNRLASNQVAV